jgi:hypothetical protein
MKHQPFGRNDALCDFGRKHILHKSVVKFEVVLSGPRGKSRIENTTGAEQWLPRKASQAFLKLSKSRTLTIV